jgi:type II secretory pathway pseudopilin PulG
MRLTFLFSRHERGSAAARAFTMIEIAICIAVIGFALVAVIGVLPRGLNTQRDNRADTVIAQDGMYWMDAIRTGAKGLDELTNYVEKITVDYTDGGPMDPAFGNGYDIIGLLSTPFGVRSNEPTRAVVRAISGSAVEQARTTRDFAFKYAMEVDIQRARAIPSPVPDVSEVRLTFRWPVTRAGTGSRSRVFRAQLNDLPYEDPADSRRFFFRP